jgi:hypothetical protein
MIDPAALKDHIASFTGKSLASQLRVLMPDIDSRVREGVDHETIVEGLAKAGLPISLNTFRVYLYRYRSKARASKTELLVERAPPRPEPITDRNIGTSPEPMEDSNPPGDTTKPEPDSETQAELRFEDMFDRKKMDAYADQFMNRQPILIGRNRTKR